MFRLVFHRPGITIPSAWSESVDYGTFKASPSIPPEWLPWIAPSSRPSTVPRRSSS